jgi:hypothetical protein
MKKTRVKKSRDTVKHIPKNIKQYRRKDNFQPVLSSKVPQVCRW